ncbi:toprim domain-containing protein [Bacillus haynesii]|uniref:toprim domain-containing protein n=1 Tax=Bacillus haynesii TaxID=1925021 RepID=UPI00227E4F71|nr:toprim domain-containing protein [Bacillus haynesii]MCY8048432.1 toprim domain-containing protein [Bacillus haynesii]MCY8668771.1 toprim domain-containing protein [Bacillus haynesii]
MRLRGIDLEIDYLEELEEFDVWHRPRVRENKFQCCSPFRTEKHPSFAVNLDNGLWIDSGASNEEWRKGNFVTLLAWLRQETAGETIDYLVEKYAPFNVDVDTLELDLGLELEEKPSKVFQPEEYEHLLKESDYLSGRGVSVKVQEVMQTGRDDKHNAVSFAWHNKNGDVVNIKFRSEKEKYFWYADGQPIKYHVFGLFLVRRLKKETVFVVESEIDALYLWSNGFPAIALGRAGMSDAQRDLILNSGIKTLVIATDNDRAGRRAGLEIISALNGYMDIHTIDFPDNVKDVNDIKPDTLKGICKKHRPIHFKVL